MEDDGNEGWEALFNARKWDELEYYCLHHATREECRETLIRLAEIVPKKKMQNGAETWAEHVLPSEVPKELKGAAELLYFGELAAKAYGDKDGNPPSYKTLFKEDIAHARNLMEKYVDCENPTEGDELYSRRSHAKTALEAMDRIEMVLNWACSNAEKGTLTSQWIEETLREACHFAFWAGASARAAAGKEIETDAVRGRKILVSAREAGKATSKRNENRRNAILKSMIDYTKQGLSAREAAVHTAKKGVGIKAASIERLFYRWKKKNNAAED